MRVRVDGNRRPIGSTSSSSTTGSATLGVGTSTASQNVSTSMSTSMSTTMTNVTTSMSSKLPIVSTNQTPTPSDAFTALPAATESEPDGRRQISSLLPDSNLSNTAPKPTLRTKDVPDPSTTASFMPSPVCSTIASSASPIVVPTPVRASVFPSVPNLASAPPASLASISASVPVLAPTPASASTTPTITTPAPIATSTSSRSTVESPSPIFRNPVSGTSSGVANNGNYLMSISSVISTLPSNSSPAGSIDSDHRTVNPPNEHPVPTNSSSGFPRNPTGHPSSFQSSTVPSASDDLLLDCAERGDASVCPSQRTVRRPPLAVEENKTSRGNIAISHDVSSASSTMKNIREYSAGGEDDRVACDSSSTSSGEAYNSEDEHPGPEQNRVEIPIRTLREREQDFADKLRAKGLRIVDMRPDGNCLFRALAHVVWNDAERHNGMRACIMQKLVRDRDYFSQFVAEDFARYVRRKSRDGVHGNHLELQAAAELFGRHIEVYSYSPDPTAVIECMWSNANIHSMPNPIRVSFHRGCHYNAVVSATDSKVQKFAPPVQDHAAWRQTTDTVATEDELERAVLALSLVEATRGDSAAGSSSSSASMIPSAVLALVNLGYSEELANEAYHIAGHGGLAEMVRYLTSGVLPNHTVTPASSTGLEQSEWRSPSLYRPSASRGGSTSGANISSRKE